MNDGAAFTSLGISLALGLLVGLQRQRSEDRLGGIRTFGLATLLGAVAGLLASTTSEHGTPALEPALVWIPAAGLLALVLVLIGREWSRSRAAAAPVKGDAVVVSGPDQGVGRPDNGSRDVGVTTELAMLLMYLVGVLVATGPHSVAVALGAGVAALLQAKPTLHRFAARLGEKDLTAIFRFALIWLVILPILPNRTFGPYDVINPYTTWLLVVLIVGISLAGYVAYRLVGDRIGNILTGLLGGLVSSTATTVSVAERSAASPKLVHAPVLIALLAGAVMCVRVAVILAVVAGEHMATLGPPIGIVFGISAAACFAAWLRARRTTTTIPPQENPTELKRPIIFVVVYVAVQFATAAAKDWLGQSGLYGVAAVSGLTDMDAITLSVGRMASSGSADPGLAWRAIVIAMISNMCFKCGIVAWLGSRAMFRTMLVYTIAMAVPSAVVVWVW
ncbi:MAG: MgtC/SapB family protein [Phycisphaerales bacterium]